MIYMCIRACICVYMCAFLCIHTYTYTLLKQVLFSAALRSFFSQHILTYASQQCIPVVIVSVKRKQSSKTWCSLSLPELKL